jgi:ADP-ribose pyrophosphatase
MDWKLIKSTIVFDNFTQIEERTYEFPDGTTKNFYIKLNKPAACILAITKEDEFILVEQFRPGPSKTLLELPGGYIDEGETANEAAVRELREETGYKGDITFVTDCFDDAYTNMHRSCFVATNCVKVSEQALDEGEYINVRLVNHETMLRLVRSGQMTDIEVAMLGLDHLKLLN